VDVETERALEALETHDRADSGALSSPSSSPPQATGRIASVASNATPIRRLLFIYVPLVGVWCVQL
jgi:hypothetical protein